MFHKLYHQQKLSYLDIVSIDSLGPEIWNDFYNSEMAL